MTEPIHGRAVKLCPPDRLPREGETIYTRITTRSVSDYIIDHETGCWNWTKFTVRGYPSSGSGTKPVRLYYERANGVKLTSETHVHHLCRNRRCLNPAHLEAVNQWEHWTDHAHEKRRLTIDDARRIRELGRRLDLTYDQIAAEFGCHISFVADILMGRRFTELGGEVIRPIRQCRECGATIPPERRRSARYCCPEHARDYNARVQAQRKKRKAA